MKKGYLIFVFFLFSLWSSTMAQEVTPLKLNQSIKGELAQETPVYYQIEAKADHFIYGYVDQIDVDVVVRILNEQDELVNSYDIPARGLEHFLYNSEESGTFKIEVAPFKEESGAYSITLVRNEPISSDPEARVDQLFSAYDNEYTPGAVVGIIEGGKVRFSKAYGMANLTHNIPLRLDMPTNIGSVTKQFTAMSILLLEKEGKLSLEDPVQQHLPEFPAFSDTIRLWHLLTHTNGLREIYNTMPMRGWQGQDALMREEAMGLVQRQTELQNAPGETFNYNNTAFILLAEIVEKISGESFPDYVKANIFEPLGMKHSYVRHNPKEIIPHSTQGYVGGQHGFEEAGDLAGAYGAGAIHTTVGDFAKWLGNFKNPVVGDAGMIQKLVSPGTYNNGDTMNYALGIGVGDYKGLERYAHTGGDNAHRALLAYFPDLDAGVAVMSNNGGFSLGLANQVFDLFYDEHLEKDEEVAEEVETERRGDDEAFSIAPEQLKIYEGSYKAEAIGLVIKYHIEDGNLMASPQGQPTLKLTPIAEHTFKYEGVDASIEFHVEADGSVPTATHTQGGELTFTRIKGYDPDAAALQAFVGRYYSEELQTQYNIVEEEGELRARHINMAEIKLTPGEEDTFAGSVFFFNSIEFERTEDGSVKGFSASNGRTSGVWFERLQD